MMKAAERPLSFSEIVENLRSWRHQPTTNQLAATLGLFKDKFAKIATIPTGSTLEGTHRVGLYCLKEDVQRYSESLPYDAQPIIEVIIND